MSPQPISRRTVSQGFAVAVVGGIAGFAVARNSDAASSKPSSSGANNYGAAASAGGRLLAPVSSVPAGGGIVLTDAKVVLTGGPGGVVHGFSAVCTHQGCLVTQVSNGTIDCPCHGSRFDAQTGAVVGGPAPAPLPKVAVTVRGGNVYSG